MLFSEDEVALSYYQIITGKVKMVNFGDGKEFVQGIFRGGQSFGEPSFLNSFKISQDIPCISVVNQLHKPVKPTGLMPFFGV